jgi:O-antigen/teichoic acid export membrane protein
VKVRDIWRAAHRSSPFGANTALTALGNIAIALLGLATGVIAARLLAPQGRGELAAIQTWANLLTFAAHLGTSEAVVYYAAREPARTGTYLTSALALSLLASIVFILAAALAMPLLLSAQTRAIAGEARLFLISVPLALLVYMPMAAHRGRSDFVAFSSLRVSPQVLWLGVLAGVWLCGRATPGFVARSYLVGLALLTIPVWMVARRRLPRPFSLDLRTWRPLLRFGLPCVSTAVPQQLNLRLDQTLIAAFLPPRQLGLYVVAVAWSGALAPMLNSVAGALMPAVASETTAEGRAHAFARGTRLAVLIAIVSAAIVLIVTPMAIVLLFGAGFRGAIPSALILVPAGAIAGLNMVAGEGLRGMGRPVEAMKAELGGLIVTAVSLALLLPSMGILGAALASLLSYATISIGLFVYSHRVTGESMSAFLMPNRREIYDGIRRIRFIVREASA